MSQQQQQSQPQPSPYGFMSYPAGVAAAGTAEYAFSPGGGPYPPPPPELAPSSSAGSVPPPPPPPPYLYAAAYAHHAHHHLGHHGHHGHHPPLPPSPIVTGAHLPPSPVLHHLQYQPHPHPPPHPPPHPHQNQQSTTTPPTSPDRYAETKAVRQLCTAVAKMQGTMRDLAERQEQILDRMSVLEQRIGRVDDSIERILENTEIAMEDSKSIRNRVEDDESRDAPEARMAAMLDQMVEKLIGGIGAEIKDLKRMVRDAERVPHGHHRNPYELARRITDADLLGQEEQKEVPDV